MSWSFPSLRARLLALALASILPLLVFSFIVQYALYRESVNRTGDRLLPLARSLIFGVDLELERCIDLLKVVARSPSLEAGDIDAFRAELDWIANNIVPGSNVLLLEPDGRHLINTGLPPGAPPPQRVEMESTIRALETGQPAVSNLFIGVVVKRPILAIDVPVTVAGRTYVLSLNPPADVFARLMVQQGLPSHWLGALLDRKSIVIARTPDPAYVGEPAAPSVAQHLGGAKEGVAEAVSRNGTAAVMSFAKSEKFGWTVVLGVPKTELVQPAIETAVHTLILGGVLLALAVGLSLVMSRRIIDPIRELRRIAAGAGSSSVQVPRSTGLPEADEVATALAESEERRQGSERGLRHLFENSPLPSWVFNSKTLAFIAVNDAALERYGYSREEFLALRMEDLRPPEDLARLRSALGNLQTRMRVEATHRYKDGTIVEVEAFSSAVVFDGVDARIVVALDVTARKWAEAQLRQAQKMEAIGMLTGGLAHHFNNLLSIILGNLGMLREGGPDDPYFEKFVNASYAAADRGASLTHSLLSFGRQHPLKPRDVALNTHVTQALPILRQAAGAGVLIDAVLAPEQYRVRVDPDLLDAALLRLVNNARDAMPEGGRITILTGAGKPDRGDAEGTVAVPAATHGTITITDTGCGIMPDVQAKMFEPFFTTKDRATGVGLGLSMVFGFVKQSDGHLTVDSQPGMGTRICLYFPLAAAAPAPTAGDAAPRALAKGNGERILVVEDDPEVRLVVSQQLEVLGYECLVAGSAAQALPILESEGPFDLVFSDVVMPGDLDGFGLAATVRRRWPGTGILLTSGFPAVSTPADVDVKLAAALLKKPYTLHELAAAVRDALAKTKRG